MLKTKDLFATLTRFDEQMAQSRNQKVELTKDQEFELSKQSKLPVSMRVGAFKVQSSVHAQARAHQRAAAKTAEEWKDFARKMVKHVEANKIKSGTYMFHSQSENRSVVGSVKGREINIVTVFPKGTGGKISHKQTAAGQKSAMMESLVESLMIQDEFESMLNEAKNIIGSDIDGVEVFDLDEVTEKVVSAMPEEHKPYCRDIWQDPIHRSTGSVAQFGTIFLDESDDSGYPLMIGDVKKAKIGIGGEYIPIDLRLDSGKYAYGIMEDLKEFHHVDLYDTIAARNYGYGKDY